MFYKHPNDKEDLIDKIKFSELELTTYSQKLWNTFIKRSGPIVKKSH